MNGPTRLAVWRSESGLICMAPIELLAGRYHCRLNAISDEAAFDELCALIVETSESVEKNDSWDSAGTFFTTDLSAMTAQVLIGKRAAKAVRDCLMGTCTGSAIPVLKKLDD